ncbi:hemolysin D [Sporolactobacillus sp. THM7-4]|nr:hemolysin D [Sporolactobacillus sp. THM7-4]
MTNVHYYTRGEEIANATIHGIGALLSVAALIILIVFSSFNSTSWGVVSVVIFGVTMIFLYTSSTLVHALPSGTAKHVFEILDHSSIYFFILGSYTPFLLVAIRGELGWFLFSVISCIAIGGTIFKCFFVRKYLFASTFLYLIMGWMIIFAWKPLMLNLPFSSIQLLFLGGLFYTAGTIFYMFKSFKFHHAIWHLFVLFGSIAHFFSILFLILMH